MGRNGPPAVAYALMVLVLGFGGALLWAARHDALHRDTVSGPMARMAIPGPTAHISVPAGETARLLLHSVNGTQRFECCRPGGWEAGVCVDPPAAPLRVRLGGADVEANPTDMLSLGGHVEYWSNGQHTHLSVRADERVDCVVTEMVLAEVERGRSR